VGSPVSRCGNAEALRLPKDVAYGEDVERAIVRSGDVLTGDPAALTVPEMIGRRRVRPAPPAVERRDTDDLPERPGLRMVWLLDTNVAIHLRDGDPMVRDRVAALDGAVLMSVVTRVERDEGAHRASAFAPVRRARLDAMLAAILTLACDALATDACARIVARAGEARRTLLARIIAAHTLVHRATLGTRNRDDVIDVPGPRLAVGQVAGRGGGADRAQRQGLGVWARGWMTNAILSAAMRPPP
jgi:predicted nucleic acid-binding protein/virulence-associated protein VagC